MFAPHYAEAVPRTLARAAALLADDSAPVAALSAGERFEVLELAGGNAWGIASARGLVGYVDEDALA